ncbi:SWIM zinc finger family protein [Methylomagnum sp.]
MTDLNDWISHDALLDFAGQTIFSRGETYFRQGAVSRLRDAGGKVSARVEGTELYEVALWTDGEEFNYDCTCPHAAEGNFCKHCVAVGLAFLAERAETGGPVAVYGRDPWAMICEYLALQPPETLLDLLMDAAQRDDGLYRNLLLKAERASGSFDLVKTFRREIDGATRNADDEELRELVDSLAELLEPDSAEALVDLAEYAIEKVEQAQARMEYYEESDIHELLQELSELHYKACEMARPDPVLLAERLFRYEVVKGLSNFHNSLSEYREVLGPSGTKRFRELAEQAWHETSPSDKRNDSRIAGIMENLAKESGDIDGLIAIKAHDLSSPWRYLKIAEICRDAGRADQALDWAERGMAAFPGRQSDNRLRDFLAEAYLARGRRDEALELIWAQFAESPRLDQYQKLKNMAERLGVWPAQRERALAELDAAIARGVSGAPHWTGRHSGPDHSERVRIALWESDPDAAWDAMQRGDCREDLRLAVAGQLEASRPADALQVYREVIPKLIEQTNNTAYEQAITLIRKASGLMSLLGQTSELVDYVAFLRVNYKAKRNFIKLLDATFKL